MNSSNGPSNERNGDDRITSGTPRPHASHSRRSCSVAAGSTSTLVLLDETWPKRAFTPLMGVGILLGVGVFLARLQADKVPEPAPV